MTSDRELYLLGATKPPRPSGAPGHRQSAIGDPGANSPTGQAVPYGFSDPGASGYARGFLEENPGIQGMLASAEVRNPLGLTDPKLGDPYEDLTDNELEEIKARLQQRGVLAPPERFV